MKIFRGILIFFVAFGWLVLLFSAIGLFYTGTIVLSILASILLTMLFLPNISQNIDLKSNKALYSITIISLLASFATCYFATPTVFGGRDQGAISTAAINLSKNHQLKFSTPVSEDLFQKYGPGKALNYPGFDYMKDGQLISRFPAGFTAYLAANYNLFGLKGIQYANAIPLFLFLVLFWLTLREFFSKSVSFFGFLLAATFFPFLWFAKYTLTETYTLFLVWTGIYFLIRARAGGLTSTMEAKPPYIYLSLAALGLSALVRIEGIAFFLLAAGYIFILNRKKIITLPKNLKKYLLVFALILLVLYLYLNSHALADSLKNVAKAYLPNSLKESAPSTNLYSYLARIFFNYNILIYLILGLIGIIWLAKNFRKNWLKPEVIPIFLTFPAFIYLISPMITLDDPWMLRRFSFAILPILIFYSVYALKRFFYHKIFLYLVFIILLATNGVISFRFFVNSENKNLLPQIETISQKFGPDDLILVDRMATGSGYSLVSEPLSAIYGKNAVYFFNADDLSLLDRAKYKNIYLAVPGEDDENNWYANIEKLPAGFSVITNNFLETSEKKFSLAVNTEFKGAIIFWKVE